eukprot:CAMPEP_0174976112 /NCGR_PEP_ID=MMETSP0004_2-20121128/12842_1 /TAXON_ID=420556 /ORGANISM="Ochromonas sp., Strain CCMP1393" /LENGTH=140 /DNA_ID=CAMNT_0016227087 /DNA_START=256 /DNA_END=679 /DNA_ORIENTATION=-
MGWLINVYLRSIDDVHTERDPLQRYDLADDQSDDQEDDDFVSEDVDGGDIECDVDVRAVEDRVSEIQPAVTATTTTTGTTSTTTEWRNPKPLMALRRKSLPSILKCNDHRCCPKTINGTTKKITTINTQMQRSSLLPQNH